MGYQLKPKTAKRNDWNETSQTTQTTNQNGCNEQNKRITVTRKKNKQKKNTTTIEISGGRNVMENVDFTSDILSHLGI